MTIFGIGVAVVVGAAWSLLTMLFAFHCGFVWGRYRISAYQFWKQGRIP